MCPKFSQSSLGIHRVPQLPPPHWTFPRYLGKKESIELVQTPAKVGAGKMSQLLQMSSDPLTLRIPVWPTRIRSNVIRVWPKLFGCHGHGNGQWHPACHGASSRAALAPRSDRSTTVSGEGAQPPVPWFSQQVPGIAPPSCHVSGCLLRRLGMDGPPGPSGHPSHRDSHRLAFWHRGGGDRVRSTRDRCVQRRFVRNHGHQWWMDHTTHGHPTKTCYEVLWKSCILISQGCWKSIGGCRQLPCWRCGFGPSCDLNSWWLVRDRTPSGLDDWRKEGGGLWSYGGMLGLRVCLGDCGTIRALATWVGVFFFQIFFLIFSPKFVEDDFSRGFRSTMVSTSVPRCGLAHFEMS